MKKVTYKFKKQSSGRYEVLHPETTTSIGVVFGESNNWHVERLDGTVLKVGYPTKQVAAEMALR